MKFSSIFSLIYFFNPREAVYRVIDYYNPEGIDITGIAKIIGCKNDTCAKYANELLNENWIDEKKIGNSRVFYIANKTE